MAKEREMKVDKRRSAGNLTSSTTYAVVGATVVVVGATVVVVGATVVVVVVGRGVVVVVGAAVVVGASVTALLTSSLWKMCATYIKRLCILKKNSTAKLFEQNFF